MKDSIDLEIMEEINVSKQVKKFIGIYATSISLIPSFLEVLLQQENSIDIVLLKQGATT
ncbi:hypothetical protein ACF0H5_014906 [Mactra antiquata]